MREMKDSGQTWLGAIPAKWDQSTIGSLYTLRNEKVSDRDYPPLSVTMKGVVPQLDTAAKTDSHDDRKLVKKGDFAINSRSDRRGSCGISSYDGSVSLINTILTPRDEMNPDYYNWVFHTSQFADEFYRWGHGIVDDLWTTRWQEMKNIVVAVPSLDEQEIIAETISSEVTKVDALIANQEAQIEKLKQYKQSLITEVVKKGFDDSAPTKDSEIWWIGRINARYKLQKIKYFICDYKAGPFGSSLITGNLLPEGKILVYTPEHIANQATQNSKNLFLPETRRLEMEQFFVHEGNIIFPIVGSLGRAMYITSDMPEGIINQRLAKFRIDETRINKDYFLYLFAKSDFYKTFLDINSRGAIIVNLTKEIVYNMPFVIPPMEEQVAIVKYLDDKCAFIDKLITVKQRKIEELNNYKKSIIYEYVTGKKEVI